MTRRVALLALAVLAAPAAAQDPTPGVDLPTDAKSPISTRASGAVLIPVLRASPLFGFGAGAVGAVVFTLDSGSQRSSLGAGGLYAQHGSWMVAIGGRAHFQQERWRALAGFAVFDVRYDFFGVGIDDGEVGESVLIAQRGASNVAEAVRRVGGHVYMGGRYRSRDVRTKLDDKAVTGPLPDLVADDETFVVSLIGPAFEIDSRDEDQAPMRGTYARAAYLFARSWLGSDMSYDSFDGWINQYVPITENDVLAFRVAGCSAGDDAPIWELCTYGANGDLRGYEAGRYRDRAMFAMQGELRAPLGGRFGAALFAGVGAISRSFTSIGSDNLLPSAGAGIRYQALRMYRLSVGADYAFGKDGGAFYFRIGEAF
jgi:hypothetical protein